MLDERMDASRRLRRVYYRDAPDAGDLRGPTLGKAVAASACVPGIFPPIALRGLYPGIDVELVDGGVHDNQGVASLLEQDCTVLLVSDASGQLRDDEDPKRWLLSVLIPVQQRPDEARARRPVRRTPRPATSRHAARVHGHPPHQGPRRSNRATGRDCQEPWQPEDDVHRERTRAATASTRDVQRELAELRTDLDSFSDDEAYALMAAGYLMTKTDLKDALPPTGPGRSRHSNCSPPGRSGPRYAPSRTGRRRNRGQVALRPYPAPPRTSRATRTPTSTLAPGSQFIIDATRRDRLGAA